MSTMHRTADIEELQNMKPEIVVYYNKTKGGVDTLDQMAHAFSTKRKTKRWPLVIFFNMLDVAGIAAYIAWLIKFPNWKITTPNTRRRCFLQNVAEELMKPHIRRRKSQPVSRDIQRDIRTALGEPSQGSSVSDDSTETRKRRRCCICPTRIDRKSRQVCSECTRNVCKEHCNQKIICHDCIE